MKRIRFAVVVVAALAACRSDRSLHPGPTADILDARHGINGQFGNPFFFWLPPMVNQTPPATMVLSRQLRPVVTITNQGPAASATAPDVCPANQLVRPPFSGADLSISEAAYHVNWHTSQDALNANCTYRITVTAGSEVLGFADVDVVNSGKELKDVNTGQFIPLLDDRTLPIRFFVGVGSQCGANVADCGEAVAVGGENTTIVTTSGRAGVFIPADALFLGQEVTITIESVDERTESGECIPGLLDQFPGTPGSVDNGCYDYHAVPVDIRIEQASSRFTFENPVTVGICPPVNAMALEHELLDRLQIFQFDEFGEGSSTVPLPNVSAPFLRCDPEFSPTFGARRSMLGDLARALASIVAPKPLYASTRSMTFDLGAGGSAEGFSRFTWALPSAVIDFETFIDGAPACASCALTDQFASRGVVFSFEPQLATCELTNAQLFLSSSVYDEAGGPENHSVTAAALPTGGFCSGTVHMAFAGSPGTVTFRIRGNNDIAVYPINAFDPSGAPIPASQIVRSDVSTFTSAAGFLFRQETITIGSETGIGRVSLVMDGFIVLLDNLLITP